eukprot:g10488.t1
MDGKPSGGYPEKPQAGCLGAQQDKHCRLKNQGWGQGIVVIQKFRSQMDVAKIAREAFSMPDTLSKAKALEEVKLATQKLRSSMKLKNIKELQSAGKIEMMEKDAKKHSTT